MKKALTLLLVLSLVFSIAACSNSKSSSSDSDDDSTYIPDYNYTHSMTESEAIAAVKNYRSTSQEIADLYGLKFYYTPDYGTCTATKSYSGDSWSVTLKGTISGYTDDYKSNFVYDKKFTVKASVSSTGSVYSVYASKY